MNGCAIIEEIMSETENYPARNEEWDNVHSQTWHDAWRDSHQK